MIVVDEAEAAALVTWSLALEAAREALTAIGEGVVNPVVVSPGLNPGEFFTIKSGVSKAGRLAGLKVGAYWPGAEARRLPRHASSILLLDPETGRPYAFVEAGALNGYRTAAADVVAAKALARSGARFLALFGAGHQAEYDARALAGAFDLRTITIVNRSPERAERLRRRLEVEFEECRVCVGSAEQAVRPADIIVTATTSQTPLFDVSWVKPGAHVGAMGADQAGKQELPPDLLRRARLFCDLPLQSVAIGEFQHIRAEVDRGQLALTAIGDVLSGRAGGRMSEAEITVFDSSGVALQDLYLAARIVERAQARRAADCADARASSSA